MKRLLAALVLALAAALPAWAQKTVTFAYQDMMNPFRWVQQTGEIEKATGYKINWRQFGGGGDVIRAMASGDVADRRGRLGRRRGRDQPGHGRRALLDPRRHRVGRGAGRAERQRRQHASPISRARRSRRRSSRRRTSTCCTRWSSPGSSAATCRSSTCGRRRSRAAWDRGDIDATFIWDPVLVDGQEERQGDRHLGRALQEGQVHVRRAHRLEEVRRRRTRDFMVALVKAIAKADAEYRGEPEGVDGRLGEGRGGRQVVGRQDRGRRRRDGALRLPEPRRPGGPGVARRRRERRRGQGADARPRSS